jgi:hypothetical protein
LVYLMHQAEQALLISKKDCFACPTLFLAYKTPLIWFVYRTRSH